MSTQAIPVLHPPVILLGMHRSGTSLIARLLDELGLFQGADLQEDHESTHFLDVNDELLKRIGASWDHPRPIKHFLAVPDAVELTVRCLRDDLNSKKIARFLGLKTYLKYRGVSKLDRPWGWKDPRSVFSLPLWLKLFPAAKLVYIVRNGVDVASSLRVRERRELERRIKEYDAKAKKASKHTMLERAGFKGSARCLTLEGGFSLWEEYVTEAEAQLAAVPNERLVVSYEQFLAAPDDPSHGLAAVAKFCGLNADGDSVAKATQTINTGRAKAFLSDPELKGFYDKVRGNEWMRRYGYASLGKEGGRRKDEG